MKSSATVKIVTATTSPRDAAGGPVGPVGWAAAAGANRARLDSTTKLIAGRVIGVLRGRTARGVPTCQRPASIDLRASPAGRPRGDGGPEEDPSADEDDGENGRPSRFDNPRGATGNSEVPV